MVRHFIFLLPKFVVRFVMISFKEKLPIFTLKMLFYCTDGAFPIITVFTFWMVHNIIIVVLMLTAFRAYKRWFNRNQWINVWIGLTWLMCLHRFFPWLLLMNQLVKSLWSFVVSLPNAAHFQNGSKLGPLHFVNVMIDFVGTIDELWMGRIYSDLDFAVDGIVELRVDHDVVCRIFESVFDSNDFEQVRILWADSFDFIENFKDFFFLGCVFAPEKIRHMKRYEIKLERPPLNILLLVLVETIFRYRDKTVN